MRITAFTKYGRMAASTRQRVLQYVPALEAAGFEVHVHPLLGDDYIASVAEGTNYPKTSVMRAYARRFRQLSNLGETGIIWVYAELFPYLPAAFEQLAFRSSRPVVYDFDDAFFIPYDENSNPAVRAILSGKLAPLIRNAAMACCGNRVLQEYAERFTSRTTILPTVVDTDRYRPAERDATEAPLTIGWIGSPSTWCNVEPLLPLLEEVCRSGMARFRAIGAGPAATGVRFPGLELAPWSEDGEIAEIQAMDIGMMPLLDRPFQRGKSGFKLVQYMACGLPSIASPVGVNSDIVDEGETGLLASSTEEWGRGLTRLMGDPALRQRFGEAGRRKAVSTYSLRAHAPRLVQVMERVRG
jgi:glycosyltransferase involved in cell wall biosynthesis